MEFKDKAFDKFSQGNFLKSTGIYMISLDYIYRRLQVIEMKHVQNTVIDSTRATHMHSAQR